MDRLSRLLVAAAAALLAIGACSDEPSAAPSSTAPVSIAPPSTQPPETGGLDIPELPGTSPAPLPSIGFGIAFPSGWNATRLDAEALERLAGADLEQPGFVDAAHAVAESGAVFYAAGADDEGRVGELKVDVQDVEDASTEAVLALAEGIAATEGFVDTAVSEPGADGRVRVDYRIEGAGTDDDGEPIDTFGSQILVPDGDRLWSIIVTSEDQVSQDALLTIFDTTFTLADR